MFKAIRVLRHLFPLLLLFSFLAPLSAFANLNPKFWFSTVLTGPPQGWSTRTTIPTALVGDHVMWETVCLGVEQTVAPHQIGLVPHAQLDCALDFLPKAVMKLRVHSNHDSPRKNRIIPSASCQTVLKWSMGSRFGFHFRELRISSFEYHPTVTLLVSRSISV